MSDRVALEDYVDDAVAGVTGFQPSDSDLTAIAALTTTSYGRAFLALADAAAGRTALGLGTAALSASGDFQPIDSDLTAIAALTTTSYGRAFLALADAAAARTAMGLGTAALSASGDFQPIDSDLTAIAALTTTSFGRSVLAAADAAALRTLAALGNVDNTADTAKPVSTAQQTALDAKAPVASPTFTGVATAPAWAASGLTGATAASRYVGSTSTGGAPTTGTFVTGDWITTIFAGIIPAIFVCTAGGTPGTWVNLTLLYATLASPTFTGTVTLPLVTGTGVDTDSTMAANSDTKLASQKATKTALALKATATAQGRTKHGGTTDYSIPGVVLTTDNTFGLTINTLFYDFFIVDTPITLDQMAFNVTTTPATTAQVRMGIYAADTDWQPTGAPTVDAGATSVANGFTGVKTASVGVTLPAGRYMTAINCDVTLGVRVFRGFPSIGSWDSSLATGGALSGGSVGSTYGALPTPSPTAWTQGRFIGNHHCVMRISTP